MPKGLYIHIPFCVQKCRYCDFVSYTCGDKDGYIKALCRELDLYRGESVDTVFIGGGTPTVLSPHLLDMLFSHINKTFRLCGDTEWTVEANPKTVNKEKLSIMREHGVNRISVGVQSFCDKELEKIGRVHNALEAAETLHMVKEYFENFNIDLISALPYQNMASFSETVNKAIAFSPTHISCYSLILEEGTPLYCENEKNPLPIPDEDTEREMYGAAVEMLQRAGYTQYEISNFAKSGLECRHNLKYWNCEDYIGAGVAAHSLINGIRFGNTTDMSEYIQGNRVKEKLILTPEDMGAEYIIMTLRLRKGIDVTEFKHRFGIDFETKYKKQIEKFISFGLMERTAVGFRLTDEGINVSNSVLCEFV